MSSSANVVESLGAPVDTPGVDGKPRLAWTVVRAVVAVVFCADGAYELLAIWQSGAGAGRIALAFVLLAMAVYIQVAYFCRPGSWVPSPRSYSMVAVLGLLAFLPFQWFGVYWITQTTFFAGSVLLVLPTVAAWPVFATVVASTVWLDTLYTHSTLTLAYTAVGTAALGVNVYLLSRLAGLVGELHTARNEL